jgi:hypothetical protein
MEIFAVYAVGGKDHGADTASMTSNVSYGALMVAPKSRIILPLELDTTYIL